jgi:hypothetical protein
MSTPLAKPEPPEDWECCESGCNPCVWDFYHEKVRLWKESLNDAEGQICASSSANEAPDTASKSVAD